MPATQTDEWQPVNAPPKTEDEWQPVNPAPKSFPFVPGMEGTTSANPQVAAQWTAKELASDDNVFIKYPLVALGTLQTFVSGAIKTTADAFKTAAGAARGEPQTLEDEISAGFIAAGTTFGELAGLKTTGPRLAKAIEPTVADFRDTVTNPIIQGKVEELAKSPNPLQSLYDHLSTMDEAKGFGIIGEGRSEATVNDSPSQLAGQAVPQSLNAARTPPEMRGTMGRGPGEYDARGKEWISKIDSPEAVRDAVEKIAMDNNFFPESRAGEPSAASRAAVAEAAGVDPKEIDSTHFASTFDNDGKVRGIIQTFRQATQDYMAAADKAAKAPSIENLADSAEAEMRVNHVLEYTLGLRAETGRSLNAWKDLLRETERNKAVVSLKGGEETGATPRGAIDLVNAVGDVQTNLKTPGAKLGLQRLIDAAEKLVAPEKEPLEPGKPRAPVPPELAGLVDEAKKALQGLKGDKTPAQFQRLIDAAEKQAINMTKQKMVKNPVEALPPELQALINKAENVVDRFGGIARGEKAALLLARTGRTPAEQEWLARSTANLTPNQVANVLAKLRTSPLARQEGWQFWIWENGLISGINTHARYAAVNAGTVASERVVAPEMAAVIGKLRGENVSLASPLYASVAMVRGVPNAFTKAAEAFKTGSRVPLLSEMKLFERGEESPQAGGASWAYMGPSPDWGIWKKVFNENQLDVAAKAFGIPQRSANAFHTFFKFLSEEGSRSSKAYDTAFKEGTTGQKFWERYQYHYDYPTDEALKASVTDAYTGAYMNKLGEQSGKLSAFLKNNKITRWVFPFQHIPWNIERMTYMYSPAPILDTMTGYTTTGKALRGELGGPAQNLAIARVTIGTSIAGYLMYKGINGQATGDYPLDPTERRRWAMLGIQPNSIQYGDEQYSMDRFAQFGNLARMGANLGEIYKNYNGQDDNALLKALGAFSLAIVNQFADETGFETARNFIDVIDGKQSASRFLSWQAGSFIPFSSLLSQAASFMDKDMRVADGVIQGLRYRIPILREGLLPKRDPIFGEPLQNPGYHTFLRQNQQQADPIKSELDRIKYYPPPPQ